MARNPIHGFKVDPADIEYIGHDLQRPECILAEPNGTLWSADARGGVVRRILVHADVTPSRKQPRIPGQIEHIVPQRTASPWNAVGEGRKTRRVIIDGVFAAARSGTPFRISAATPQPTHGRVKAGRVFGPVCFNRSFHRN